MRFAISFTTLSLALFVTATPIFQPPHLLPRVNKPKLGAPAAKSGSAGTNTKPITLQLTKLPQPKHKRGSIPPGNTHEFPRRDLGHSNIRRFQTRSQGLWGLEDNVEQDLKMRMDPPRRPPPRPNRPPISQSPLGGPSAAGGTDPSRRPPPRPNRPPISQSPLSGPSTAGGKKTFPLLRTQDVWAVYYTTITVGGQKISVQLDTGSDDFFVLHADCPDVGPAACYDPEKSPNKPKSQGKAGKPIKFLDNTIIEGEVYTDDVMIGSVDVGKQAITVSKTPVRGFGGEAVISGLVGIGTTGETSIFRQLFEVHGLKKVIAFSLSLTGGKVVIGDVDNTLTPQDKWVSMPVNPKVSTGHWDTDFGGIHVGGTLVQGPFLASVDTGAAYIYGPEKAIKAIYARIPSAKTIKPQFDSNEDYWAVPCKLTEPVQIIIKEQAFPMSPASLAGADVGDNFCTGAFQVNPSEDVIEWVIGVPFMSNVQVAYHLKTATTPPMIGFGPIVTSTRI